MRAQLTRADLDADDRLHLHFALGKALEEQGDYAESFEHTARATRCGAPSALRRRRVPAHMCCARKSLFTPEFLATRGRVRDAGDPIFIVGLPRAGSTLVEQILASHSQVEGTMELPDMPALAQTRRAIARADGLRYPQALAASAGGAARARARSTSRAPASSARPAGRSSSTSCPTTSCTSASST